MTGDLLPVMAITSKPIGKGMHFRSGFPSAPRPHAPGFPNYGFVITAGKTKIIICTDFHDAEGVLEHFVDADFIFVEANHDLDLLRENTR